ncbi:hypothetical protein M0R45_016856 [Rubus argutus]|uniref:Myb/SANT-like domain-containing protein n=1 Tax=Rubus argutus TaxID=59490 RepID=A0AAW1XW89_RUBAR
MDFQSIDQQKGRGRNKHNWTSAEDEKLVEAIGRVMRFSGFSWNDEKKMIICEKELHDGWVKSHPAAKGMWMKPFPHFDNLGNVFGKDRANGKQAASATDFVDEIDQNNDGLDDVDEIMNIPAIPTPVVAEGSNEAPKNRKRKRTYAYVLGLTQMVGAMTKTVEAMDKLVGSLAESEPMRQVYDEVSKVEEWVEELLQ